MGREQQDNIDHHEEGREARKRAVIEAAHEHEEHDADDHTHHLGGEVEVGIGRGSRELHDKAVDNERCKASNEGQIEILEPMRLEGLSQLWVARLNGIDLNHFTHSIHLLPAAACLACLLISSCNRW